MLDENEIPSILRKFIVIKNFMIKRNKKLDIHYDFEFEFMKETDFLQIPKAIILRKFLIQKNFKIAQNKLLDETLIKDKLNQIYFEKFSLNEEKNKFKKIESSSINKMKNLSKIEQFNFEIDNKYQPKENLKLTKLKQDLYYELKINKISSEMKKNNLFPIDSKGENFPFTRNISSKLSKIKSEVAEYPEISLFSSNFSKRSINSLSVKKDIKTMKQSTVHIKEKNLFNPKIEEIKPSGKFELYILKQNSEYLKNSLLNDIKKRIKTFKNSVNKQNDNKKRKL